MSRKALWAALGLVATVTPALAHGEHGHAFGIVEGFAHPFGGLDHVLAMVAVGLLAAQIGGRALWALPLAFLSMMVAGGAFGVSGYGLPLVELGIALSTIAFGIAIASGLGLPVALGALLVGGFALFHGHAHGAEMPEGASALGYAAGFVGATAILHGAGLALGLALGRFATPSMVRAAGGGVALAGLVLLARLA